MGTMVNVGARAASVLVTAAALASGCSDAELEAMEARAEEAMVDGGAEAVDITIDSEVAVTGVLSRGRDPAVVLVRREGAPHCSGVLVGTRVVLTARSCVAEVTPELRCPADAVQVRGTAAPGALEVLVGDDATRAEVVARAVEIVAPDGVTLCGADIAALVLDRAVSLVKPRAVRSLPAGFDERLRAVGFARKGQHRGRKVAREHVRVDLISEGEVELSESTCRGDVGGAAFDEKTGELVAVIARAAGSGPCDGPGARAVATRIDSFYWLVDEAFRRARLRAEGGEVADGDGGTVEPDDGGASKPGSKGKPPSDVGGGCVRGEDCAAGVCLAEADRGYCSRPCGPGDRCPNGFHCRAPAGDSPVCVRAR